MIVTLFVTIGKEIAHSSPAESDEPVIHGHPEAWYEPTFLSPTPYLSKVAIFNSSFH